MGDPLLSDCTHPWERSCSGASGLSVTHLSRWDARQVLEAELR
jgi:hypothetical protein